MQRGKRAVFLAMVMALVAVGCGSAGSQAEEPQTALSIDAGSEPVEEGRQGSESGTKQDRQETKGTASGSASEPVGDGGNTPSGKAAPTLAAPSVTGALRVEGTQLVGSGGEAVQLRGISTHGLAWFPDYVNEACFQELRENWQANVVRLALYTAEYGGYCNGGDQAYLKGLIEDGVEYAARADVYVIIDWHILSDGNPLTHLAEAKAFFGEMSARYADRDHVLYEICNEPNGDTSWQDIKDYAEEVIGIIRENDADAVILVGTPNWSQYIDQAAADPISGYENIMYTLHFYAATHKEELRDRMAAAVEAGLPVFVSEFGICDASGSGAIDEAQADAWVQRMDALGISYVAWNLSNKEETSALLKSSCQKSSGFNAEDVSASGQWLLQVLAGSGKLPENPAKEEAPAEEASNPASESVLMNGSIEITAALVNSWEADGEPVYHYSLTLHNVSENGCTGWAVDVGFTGTITLLDGWNGDYSADGNILHITSKDYNGRIEAGDSVSDVGFIVSGGSIAP